MIEITQEEVMQNWNGEIPLVSVCCITYNQEPYIAQALDGFLMQKTSFPFEILIHDDASTDRTADIIREYEAKFPKLIKPIYQKENQYSKGNRSILASFVYPRAKGKYMALCEGDDYWIDENKLQMQVNFLENNPEYGMCYSKAKQYIQSKQQFNKNSVGDAFDGFEDLLKNGNRIPTLTTVYRKDLLDKYQKEIQPSNKGWLMGDYPMWLYFSHESKVKFFDKVTAVYRVLEESASHSVDVEKQLEFSSSYYNISKYFAELYNFEIPEFDIEKLLFDIYFGYFKMSGKTMFLDRMRGVYEISNISTLKYKMIYMLSFFPKFLLFVLWIKKLLCK